MLVVSYHSNMACRSRFESEPSSRLVPGLLGGETSWAGGHRALRDEKTYIQAFRHWRVVAPTSNHGTLVDSLYTGQGTVCYLAALDVFLGTVIGHVVEKAASVPFGNSWMW